MRQLITSRTLEREKYSDHPQSREFKEARRKLRTARGQLDRAEEKAKKALEPFEKALSDAWFSLRAFDERFAMSLRTNQELIFFLFDRMPGDHIGRDNVIARFLTRPGFTFDPLQLLFINSHLFDLELQTDRTSYFWNDPMRRKREKAQVVEGNIARQSEIISKRFLSRIVGAITTKGRQSR